MSAERHAGAGHRERLRQRFLRVGFAGFEDHEIIELILTLCIPRSDVKAPAKALLERFGSVRGVLDADPEELREVPGVGSVTPVALRIVRDTASLYLQQQAEGGELLNSMAKIQDFWIARLGGLKQEVFEVGYLDKGLCLLRDGVERLETGTVDQTMVYPRKVMTAALERSAAAVVVVHNHPSGRPEPSDHDIRLTRALVAAGKPLGVEVVEHLIVARDKAYSFRKNGKL